MGSSLLGLWLSTTSSTEVNSLDAFLTANVVSFRCRSMSTVTLATLPLVSLDANLPMVVWGYESQGGEERLQPPQEACAEAPSSQGRGLRRAIGGLLFASRVVLREPRGFSRSALLRDESDSGRTRIFWYRRAVLLLRVAGTCCRMMSGPPNCASPTPWSVT
ncbi:hypothetical protein C8Q77DRAFT_367061 [Trametes polyzona]|nr:hypothetical protein C8Q77DRAFT_366164 [Trametes polyzona]KAI0628714.1 hypothetical protein C8Q77DRAFT_367061 [Trametes polyzona]